MNDDIWEQWFINSFLKHSEPARPYVSFYWTKRKTYMFWHSLLTTLGSVFGPFNKPHNSMCSECCLRCPAMLLTNGHSLFFLNAVGKELSKEGIVNVFKSLGFYPVNKYDIPEVAYLPSTVYDKPMPQTRDTSPLTCSI